MSRTIDWAKFTDTLIEVGHLERAQADSIVIWLLNNYLLDHKYLDVLFRGADTDDDDD